MSKIKLLTLLLISFFFVNCSSTNYQAKNNKYSLDYISGGYDGLVLKKQLISKLRGFRSYDQDSRKSIQSEITHSTKVFVTNIDNTSEREEVISSLKIRIIDTKLNNTITHFKNGNKYLFLRINFKKILCYQKYFLLSKVNVAVMDVLCVHTYLSTAVNVQKSGKTCWTH